MSNTCSFSGAYRANLQHCKEGERASKKSAVIFNLCGQFSEADV